MDGDRGRSPDCLAHQQTAIEDLALPSPDWLYHHLTVTGPAEDIARFRKAAIGPGIIPWRRDYDALVEQLVMLMIRPRPFGCTGITLSEARRLAGKLRDLYWQDDQMAFEHWYRQTPRCPFDLHRLLPVPDKILERGIDAPSSIRWLWEHWGVTQPLRRVHDRTAGFRTDPATTAIFEFWSADWSPWRAMLALADDWPTLQLRLSPQY